jgi:uncharacterized membrane protein HdeD (DUF308 family)
MFLERAARRWWTLAVRGLLAIAFGVLTILVPQAAVRTIVLVFGVYAIAEGITSLGVFLSPVAEGSWLIALSGILSVAVGLYALLSPGITAAALFLVIAMWAIVIGVIELGAAVRYSREIENEWALVLSGLLWIGLGVIMIGWPGIGIVAVLALIATAAILRGVTLIVAAARLRTVYQRLRGGADLTART